MLKEFLIFAMFFLFVYVTHWLSVKWTARKARQQKADNENAIGLEALSSVPEYRPRSIIHVLALCVATAGPACVEAVKHYAVHFLIYSGYIIRH